MIRAFECRVWDNSTTTALELETALSFINHLTDWGRGSKGGMKVGGVKELSIYNRDLLTHLALSNLLSPMSGSGVFVGQSVFLNHPVFVNIYVHCTLRPSPGTMVLSSVPVCGYPVRSNLSPSIFSFP